MKNILTLLGIMFLAATARAQISDSLVAYYPFNNNANDATGHGFNGMATKIAVPVKDRFGHDSSAYFIDYNLGGYGEWGINVDSINTSLFDSAVSISFWINSEAPGNNDFIIFGNTGANQWIPNFYMLVPQYQLWILYVQFNGGGLVSAPSTLLMNGQWLNIITTCRYKGIDANNFRVTTKIYINGKYINGDSVITPKFIGIAKGDLAMSQNSYMYLDDVRLYNKVLSASDIKTLAGQTKSGFPNTIPESMQSPDIYPNPAHDKIYINTDARVDIYNMSGQILKTADHEKELDLQSLSSGIYILAIETKEGIIYQKQVIEP